MQNHAEVKWSNTKRPTKLAKKGESCLPASPCCGSRVWCVSTIILRPVSLFAKSPAKKGVASSGPKWKLKNFLTRDFSFH